MDETNELHDLLRQVGCFADMDSDVLRLLEQKMTLARYGAGQVISREGERDDTMYIIKSGRVRVLRKGKDGADVETGSLEPGDFGGVTSLFAGEPRSATLQAAGDVEAWTLDHASFQRLLQECPALSQALLTFMSRNLRREWRLHTDLQGRHERDEIRMAVFDSKSYSRSALQAANQAGYALRYFEHRLTLDTAWTAEGFRVICCFVNDTLDAPVVERLAAIGVELIAMRCAGYNNVDLEACSRHGVSVARVPAYSPDSVAEHSIALILSLNRHIHKAYVRVREGNFSLEGMVGFEMRGKIVGIIGTGRIGKCAANILLGFGCEVLAYDKYRDEALVAKKGLSYVELDELLSRSDVISLHVPLMPETHHMIDARAIDAMKRGVMLVNTSRGGLLDTRALIDGLKSGHIGSAALDVYEEESDYFFEDFSGTVITDDVLARLLTFPNVVVTSHQAFLTYEALHSIAETTMANIREYAEGKRGTDLTNGLNTIPAQK
jgi:D-lactate dehydrogenase